MNNIAVFPGSFDPFTIGHESIVKRGLTIFDKIIIGVGYNVEKKYFMPLENRIAMIKDVFANEQRIEVKSYDSLTVEFCKSVNSKFLLRGLRTAMDFEYERAIAQNNRLLAPETETVFILTLPEHSHINSTIVRDIIKHKGNVTGLIPENINYKKYMPV